MSAQKQCPKCGEKNPAEAVMCWACYTSLTGGGVGAAALAGAGAPMGGATPIADSDEKKKIDPKHLAIIGIGLLVAAGFGVSTMMGSGGDEELTDLPAVSVSKGGDGGGGGTTTTQVPVTSGNNPSAPGSPGGGGGSTQTIAPPYRIVLSPHPRQTWGTMALVPSAPNTSEGDARTYVINARQNLERSKKFAALEIFVINDQAAGSSFALYQRKRRNAPLRAEDYSDPALAHVWKSTVLRYVKDGKKELFNSPQRNPNGFWNEQPKSR